MAKHSYNNVFNKGEDIIEVKVMDASGNRIDARRCKASDKESLLKIFRWLKSKYNVAIENDFLTLDNEFFKF